MYKKTSIGGLGSILWCSNGTWDEGGCVDRGGCHTVNKTKGLDVCTQYTFNGVTNGSLIYFLETIL